MLNPPADAQQNFQVQCIVYMYLHYTFKRTKSKDLFVMVDPVEQTQTYSVTTTQNPLHNTKTIQSAYARVRRT